MHMESVSPYLSRRTGSVRRMDPAGSAAAAAHAEEVRGREEQEVERDDPERLAQTRAMDEYKDGAHSALVLSHLGFSDFYFYSYSSEFCSRSLQCTRRERGTGIAAVDAFALLLLHSHLHLRLHECYEYFRSTYCSYRAYNISWITIYRFKIGSPEHLCSALFHSFVMTYSQSVFALIGF